MASTGELYATAAQTIAEAPWSDNTWENPNNALGSPDGINAAITASTYDSGDQSYVLKLYAFGISIPAGSTIDGVIVRCYDVYTLLGTTAGIGLMQLLNISRAKVGTNKAATEVPVSEFGGTFTFGAANDLWGNALTEAWVEDPDFGVAFGMWARSANTDVFLDTIGIEVFYTAPGGAPDSDNFFSFI